MTTETMRIDERLRAAGFVVELAAEPDDMPIRGNALASGDDDIDRRAENDIIEQLDAGNAWAWASVRVCVTHPAVVGIEGNEYLGCCSYASEDDFKADGGYYDDMVHEALRAWHVAAGRFNVDDLGKAMTAAQAILG